MLAGFNQTLLFLFLNSSSRKISLPVYPDCSSSQSRSVSAVVTNSSVATIPLLAASAAVGMGGGLGEMGGGWRYMEGGGEGSRGRWVGGGLSLGAEGRRVPAVDTREEPATEQ